MPQDIIILLIVVLFIILILEIMCTSLNKCPRCHKKHKESIHINNGFWCGNCQVYHPYDNKKSN